MIYNKATNKITTNAEFNNFNIHIINKITTNASIEFSIKYCSQI